MHYLPAPFSLTCVILLLKKCLSTFQQDELDLGRGGWDSCTLGTEYPLSRATAEDQLKTECTFSLVFKNTNKERIKLVAVQSAFIHYIFLFKLQGTERDIEIHIEKCN